MGKKVFFIASEAQPYIASGGLGDVIGSLPKAIAKASKEQYPYLWESETKPVFKAGAEVGKTPPPDDMMELTKLK